MRQDVGTFAYAPGSSGSHASAINANHNEEQHGPADSCSSVYSLNPWHNARSGASGIITGLVTERMDSVSLQPSNG